MPLPRERPSSGSLRGPNTTSAITKITMSSGIPIEPNTVCSYIQGRDAEVLLTMRRRVELRRLTAVCHVRQPGAVLNVQRVAARRPFEELKEAVDSRGDDSENNCSGADERPAAQGRELGEHAPECGVLPVRIPRSV